MDSKTLTRFTEQNFTTRTWGEAIRFEPKPRPCGHCQEITTDQRLTLSKKNYEHRACFWEIKCNCCDFKMTVKDLTKFKNP